MSEYFLAEERARQRERERERATEKRPKAAQKLKVTLLGEFALTTSEPQGCDPYNSSLGKAAQDAWQSPRLRR